MTDIPIEDLIRKTREFQSSLEDLILSTDNPDRLEKINMYLDWLLVKTIKVKEEPTFQASSLPILKRGDVVLIDLGFNVGEEFGGQHAGIVLRNSGFSSKRALVLPITSQEPKNKLPIYVKIGKIYGLDPSKFHWANIFNINNISKQRIVHPPSVKRVNGKVLNRISATINSQIVY